jgi:hypothetical protein
MINLLEFAVTIVLRPHTARLRFLCNPEPNPLNHVPWLDLRPDLRIECSLARPDVSLGCLDEVRAFEDPPEQIEGEVDWDGDVTKTFVSKTAGFARYIWWTYAVMKFLTLQLPLVKTAKPLKITMMQKKASATYALHGWNLLRNGSWSLVTPCALQAARKRKNAMRMEIQVNSEVIVVSVWNQLKTVAAPALTVM